MKRYCVLAFIVFFIVTINTTRVYAMEFTYVDVSKQLYSYDAMVEDIALLAADHEGFFSYESIATTSQGRNVWLIKFGNLDAENKIFITGSIHAREYMCSQLIMRMLEEYTLHFDVYQNAFNSVCFYILPMVNPDGVSISQYGAAGATQQYTKDWLRGLTLAKVNLSMIKANGNGVDLNRNFPVGFGNADKKAILPSLSYYPGSEPLSEIETLAIAKILYENKFVMGINYHSMGNIVYYGAKTNSKEVDEACKALACVAHELTSYKLEYCGKAIGSLSDYFGAIEQAPSITIEIGKANPVPISQFDTIYEQNVALWPTLANIL